MKYDDLFFKSHYFLTLIIYLTSTVIEIKTADGKSGGIYI